jgi:proline dehydrogenase
MSTPILRDLAGRFVGGDSLESAITAVRGLNARGIKGSLNFHGMHVVDTAEAHRAADQAIEALRLISTAGIDSHVSVKLTKIGHDIDSAIGQAQLRRILDCASETKGFVRIDMEESRYLDETLHLFEEMLGIYGNRTVGLVIQSYLMHRTDDLERLMSRGASIRLVKGGYRESGKVVFHAKADIDDAFKRDIERLLRRGTVPAIATHDADAIVWTKAIQKQLGLGNEAFEFQMLYGVKPELQDSLVAEGYTVRCYVPYGGDWATHVIGCLRRLPASLFMRLKPFTSAKKV